MHRFILHNDEIHEASERLLSPGQVDLTAHVDAANYPIICHDTVRMIKGYLREFETGVTFERLLAMVGENIRDSLEARVPGGRLWVSDEAYAAARDVHRPALQEAFAVTGPVTCWNLPAKRRCSARSSSLAASRIIAAPGMSFRRHIVRTTGRPMDSVPSGSVAPP